MTSSLLEIDDVTVALPRAPCGFFSADIDDAAATRSNRLGFNERTIAGVTVLDLGRRLTLTSGAAMGRRIQALLWGGATHLVLNLEDVSYVDSAGLGAIIEAFTVARHKAVRLTLLNPTERTRHLLEITGLARILETFGSEAAVLASCETAEDKHVVSSAPQP